MGGPLFRLLLCPLVLGCLKVLFRASRSVYDSVSLDYFSRLEFCWPESGVPYEAFQFMSFLFRRMRMGFVFGFALMTDGVHRAFQVGFFCVLRLCPLYGPCPGELGVWLG